MNYSDTQIWIIIIGMGIGTFAIRFSFLGPLAHWKMPAWTLRLLRYTPVAVIPGLVAPLVMWPAATGGEPDLARILAASATLALGYFTRNVILAILGGAGVLFAMLYLLS